jgi:hypothetical protein
LNLIGFDSLFGLVIVEQIIQVPVIIPVIITTGLIILKASTDSSRGKIGGRCLGILGRSKLGLVMWPTGSPPVMLQGYLGIGRSEDSFGGQAHASKNIILGLGA